MSWFKRLCLFVFGLSGLLALVALCLTWVGPWTTQARSMLEIGWYFTTLEVLACVSSFGLLVCLLVSLFYPRNPKETIVAEVPGGTITVTRSAIVSQARHIVEEDGTCVPASVHVRMSRRGRIRVSLRLTPQQPIDVVKRGEILYAALDEGLSRVCADSVQKVSILFNEPNPRTAYASKEEPSERSNASAPVIEVNQDNRSQSPYPQSNGRQFTVAVSSLAPYETSNEAAGEVVPEPDPIQQEPANEYGYQADLVTQAEGASALDEADDTLGLSANVDEEA